MQGSFKTRLHAAVCLVGVLLGGCTPDGQKPVASMADMPSLSGPTWLPEDGQKIRWKAILVGGDSREAAFDNAARSFAALLQRAGIAETDIAVLSAYQRERSQSADFSAIRDAMTAFSVRPGDGCLVFVTAHGSPSGLYLRGMNAYYYLSPAMLHGLLAQACKQAPTVIVASGCYSGVFAAPPMLAPNRVIYTAARRDRTSFGCDAQLEYTYFDHCFLVSLPETSSWDQLAHRSRRCVNQREMRERTPHSSEPQYSAGSDMPGVTPPQVPREAIADIWWVVPPSLQKAEWLPFGGKDGRQALARYKSASGGKAIAVGPNGGWAWIGNRADEEAATVDALAACRVRAAEDCLLYAVGDRLVWHMSLQQALVPGFAGNVRLVQAD